MIVLGRFTLCSSIDVRFTLNSDSLILRIMNWRNNYNHRCKKLQMLANNINIKLLNDQWFAYIHNILCSYWKKS